tara:strand:+ start:17074 stop:18693 length:1620 start_codon:yes stop_codon:yes gene_type:complete
MSKARVGLIIDNKSQSWSIFDLIEKSLKSNDYEISCLIIQESHFVKRKNIVKSINEFCFKVIAFFERIFVKRFINTNEFFKKHPINSFDLKKISVKPIVSKSGFVHKFSTEDINKIKKENLDILVRGGSGILRGEILNICKKGIISFHHGDNDVNRGSPPGFWEVYKREKSTGFVIQILNEELDGGDVIFKGNIPTSYFYTLNMIKLYKKANVFMHLLLEDIFKKNNVKVFSKKPYDKPLYLIPSIGDQLIYLFKTFKYLLKKLFNKILGRKLKWNVAYQYSNDWRDISIRKSKIIKNPPNSFIADPFLFRRNQKDYCFVEEYDFSLKKGHISVYEFNDEREKYIGKVIDENFHLSYPNVFEDNGQIYMIPESSAAKEVRLYRCLDFPLKWKLEKVLINNISAVDSNIFKLNNKWWILTNIDTSNSGEHCSELHAFYSENLISNNWTSHPKNPLIFDSQIARNAGIIFDNDNIFRSFQIQGWDKYGEGVGVSKIIKLDEHDYKEKIEFKLSSDSFKDATGTHTYNFKNGIMVTDFVSLK